MLRIAFSLVFALCSMLAAAQSAPAPAENIAKAKRERIAPIVGESALAKIDAKGTLRVGVAVNGPWVMHDKSGELFGYSIDVARKIADDMGWKLELVTTSWPKILYDLRTNQFDIAISGISITPQRARFVRFTRPYGEYDIGVVANRAKFAQGDMAALAKADKKRIAVRGGTLNADFARAGLPAADIVEVDDEPQAIADLREGKYDALVAEAPAPKLIAQMFPEQLRALDGAPLARTAHAMAVRRGDNDLADVLDAWIIEAEASGWLKSRGDYWFDSTDWIGKL